MTALSPSAPTRRRLAPAVLVPLLSLLALGACRGSAASASLASAAPGDASSGANGHVHAESCELAPFALVVTELGADALGVGLVAPDGTPVLTGQWSRRDARYFADSLALLGRFAVELADAPEQTFDFTEELSPEAVAELASLGGAAHREGLLQSFEGETRAAADQLALAAASLGSLLSRAPVVRAVSGEDGGTCGTAPGYFPRACADHAYCYALAGEAGAADRATCDARFLADMRAEATFQSEPFVELVHAAARAYGWRAWPLDAAR